MRSFPTTPSLEDAPESLFDRGHLWIQEYVDGAPLRFAVQESGLVRFGDRQRVFRAGDVPAAYRHATRSVQERLDLDRLYASTDDVEGIVFFGVATQRRSIEYDWARIPSFLGTDVWSTNREGFLPVDQAERVYAELGLDPVNAFEKEVDARYFDPDAYRIPDSAWYDGPAAGVVFRNKTGDRATRMQSDIAGPGETPTTTDSTLDADALADRYVTAAFVDRVVAGLEANGKSVGFDAVYERVVDETYRVADHRLDADRVDTHELNAAIASRVRTRMNDGA